MNIGQENISRVGDVHQTGPLLILVGTGRIPFSAQPESLPGTETVSVNGALAADDKAIHTVSIDNRRIIKAALALNACFAYGIVCDPVTALQYAILVHIQIDALLKKQRTGKGDRSKTAN